MTAIPAWCSRSRRKRKDIKSIKDLAGKAVGVSAPGSSTDFFLKYLLAKNGMDPASASVVGIGLAATAVAAMEHGKVQRRRHARSGRDADAEQVQGASGS